MKKRILSLIMSVLVFVVTMTCAFAEDYYEPEALDKFDNVLFEVVGEIHEVSLDDAKNHGEIIEEYVFGKSKENASLDENGVPESAEIYRTTTYQDGAETTEYITDMGFFEYVYPATSLYPAYIKGSARDKFITFDNKNYNPAKGEHMIDVYLIEKDGDKINKTIIASEEKFTSMEYPYESTYNIYKAEVVEGEVVRTKLNDETISEEEYEIMRYGSSYNDGLKFVIGEGYVDINGECVMSEGMVSYYFVDYNMGYVFESTNNGDVIDWGAADPEKLRRYTANYKNIITGESYYFENACMEKFNDKGYTTMGVKDDEGNETFYLVKLKKPAIVTVSLNGSKIRFDQIPVIDSGRTLVPLRAIFERLGAEIEWNGETKTVTATKGDTKIELTVDSKSATKNGETVELEVPAKIIGGRTLVPVRFIADCFGVDVGWDDALKQVILTEK